MGKESSESILASSLAGDIARRRLKRRQRYRWDGLRRQSLHLGVLAGHYISGDRARNSDEVHLHESMACCRSIAQAAFWPTRPGDSARESSGNPSWLSPLPCLPHGTLPKGCRPNPWVACYFDVELHDGHG